MVGYPIGDFLIRLKNAYLAKKEEVVVPYSKMNERLAKILAKHSFIGGYRVKEEDKKKKTLVVSLVYSRGKPALTEVKLISKPGRRIYASVRDMPFPPTRLGIVLVSTPKGVLTAKEAVKKKVGGEVIGYVW